MISNKMKEFLFFIFASSVFSLVSTQKVLFTNKCLKIVDQKERIECEETMDLLLQKLNQTLRSDQIIIPDLCENSNCFEDPVLGRHCQQNGISITCSCPGTGYRDVGLPNKIAGVFCEDVDECAEGSDRCGEHGAKCTNEVGSYGCECEFPYTGDGRNCETNDECQIDDVCHKNAECQPIKKYQGCYRSEVDSSSLIEEEDMDADLCIKHCRKHHNTTNYAQLHGSRCYCKDELPQAEDQLQTCELPCAGNNRQLCGGESDDVSSFYVTGQLHSCTCKSGYHGDGVTSCDDVDECEDDEKCCADATCTNTVGGYNCACNDGLIMTSQNGCQQPKVFPCVDRTSEKQEMWFNCSTVLLLPCDFNGTDLMSNGDLYHLEGSGPYGKCKNHRVTTKVDRKLIKVNQGQEELKKTLRLNTECLNDESALITIDRFAANAVNWTLKDIFLGPMDSYTKAKPYQANPKCKGEVIYGDGSFYRFKASKECGATSRYMVEARSNVVEGALHARVGFEGKLISRLTNLYIEYKCAYNTKHDGNDVIKPTASSVPRKVKVAEKKGRKHTSKVADKNSASSTKSSTLSVWSTPNYINLGGIVESKLTMTVATHHKKGGLAAVDVTSGERLDVYISVQQIHKNKKLLIQPVRCWAEDLGSGSWKTILKNGCNDVTAGADVTFEYQPFAFVGGSVEKQKLRCLLKFCWEAEACKQECRAVLDEKKNELDLDWTTAVVNGPEVWVQDRCGPKYKGGCEHYCSANQFTKEPVCSCFENFKLYDDKMCKVDVGLGSVPTVEIAIAVVVLFFLVVVAVVWGRKRYKDKEGRTQFYSFARGLGDDIGEVADSSILQ